MRMITIILPVYNDWPNLFRILTDIERIKKKHKIKINTLIVNDSSTDKFNYKKFNFEKTIYLNLRKNVGSQKAIATGIMFAIKSKIGDRFIVMDSDGEDNPNEISNIIKLSKNEKIQVITMNRTMRHESFLFSILYELHLFITFFLTFHYIRFGNFTYLKLNSMKKISLKKDLWMAYSSTVSKYLSKKENIIAPRKKRYSGKSKMKYWQLFLHSFRILGVFRGRILMTSVFYLMLLGSFFDLDFYNVYFLIPFLFLTSINSTIIAIHLYFKKNKLKLFNCLKNIKSIKVYKKL